MGLISLAVAVAALGGLLWVDRRSGARFEGFETADAPTYDDRPIMAALEVLEDRIGGLQGDLQGVAERVSDQTLAIAEGIQHVDRAERRVRAAVGRARNRMAELGYVDEGIEAEAQQLRELDGGASASEPVPPLQPDMGGDSPRDMSAFPGVW